MYIEMIIRTNRQFSLHDVCISSSFTADFIATHGRGEFDVHELTRAVLSALWETKSASVHLDELSGIW